MFLFARHAHDRAEQLIACRLLPRRGLEPESLLLEKAAREQPALVGPRRGQRRDEIVEARADQLDRPAQDRLLIRGVGFDRTHHRARLLGERRPEQQPVDDRVFVALLEARADFLIVGVNPRGPPRFPLLVRKRDQRRRKPLSQLGDDRPDLREVDEPRNSGPLCSASGGDQSDTNSPTAKASLTEHDHS